MKHILVTGGAGFIGSHLVDALLKLNHKVTVLDNLSTGNYDNIKHHKDNQNFTFLEKDIRDRDGCLEATKDIDVILHQAALGSVPRSIDDPLTSHDVNVTGMVNLLHAAVQNKVKRFVYASSSSTYGDNQDAQKVEERRGQLLSPYAVTKKVDELYAQNFYKVYSLETIGLVYFNVFGPRQNPNGPYAAVIPVFVDNVLQNKESTINGDGTISRDFTFVENVVSANMLAMITTNEKAFGNTFNVSCGDSISLNELYKAIKESLSSNIEAVHGPLRKGDILHSCANISKAQEVLNYKPLVKWQEGLKRTCNWYKENK